MTQDVSKLQFIRLAPLGLELTVQQFYFYTNSAVIYLI